MGDDGERWWSCVRSHMASGTDRIIKSTNSRQRKVATGFFIGCSLRMQFDDPEVEIWRCEIARTLSLSVEDRQMVEASVKTSFWGSRWAWALHRKGGPRPPRRRTCGAERSPRRAQCCRRADRAPALATHMRQARKAEWPAWWRVKRRGRLCWCEGQQARVTALTSWAAGQRQRG